MASLKRYRVPPAQGKRGKSHICFSICKGLVTNYTVNSGQGMATKREGGHVKFYPYEMVGGKSFSQAEGGHKKFWGSFYAVA